LKGRLSRYIKILGKRISLDEVENILKNNFENDEIVCSGADNQLLVCYVSKIERTESFEEQLVSFLNTSLDIPQRFVACKCLECIPRNETGKILYAKLGEI
ncbi:MAG: AMP-dependent synthetase, partial [Lachnospiraceae bacterium]|nr:AMP-dependent synthetase [Lachnospiraceae bacterium]